ncbi:unnamed protein product [Medioppia subpectinata]|uniref:Nuclear hormone receptor HR96 n=1 Tax=Medioppia subpectinata TaxID=1979941 RepID=A0A7R9KDG8_9ACAR|nr:unnamed protein product [Medioppia subpectinata]CAG2101237.1 unnamed protein product [Medioppia subpectinata]
MSDRGVPKFCAVCGHKALGKNFGALSCEPCKAFFRRNGLKDNLKCHFNSNCKINEITRKFCSKCRLEKCLAIGMRRDFIVNEVEKDWRRVKHFRANPKNNDITDNLSSDQSCEPPDPSPDINDCLYDLLDDNHFSVDELNKQILDIECGVSTGDVVHNNTTTSQMEIIAKTNDNTEISDEVMQMAVEFELAVIPIARPVGEYHCPFNDTETYLMNELINSVKLIGQPRSKVTMEIKNFDDYNRTVSYKFDRGVRNMARAAKELCGFRALYLDDQITLLKYGCIEAILMRTIKHVDYGRKLVILPWDGENSLVFKLAHLKLFRPYDSYDTYMRYLHKMTDLWDSDPVILDLMLALILFNPDRPNLINRDGVKRQQHVYMYLLQRYLILKYQTECEAKTRFLRLMNVLSDINLMREIQRRHAMQSSLVTPLLQEVFDISPAPMEPMGDSQQTISPIPS